MLRVFAIAILTLSISSEILAQKKNRKARKAKAAVAEKVVEEKKEEKSPDPVPEEKPAPEVKPVAETAAPTTEDPEKTAEPINKNSGDEMEAYRAIQRRPLSTVQDMADVMLMYRAEYGKYKTPQARLDRARELKILKSQKGDEKLERGALAYAIMNIYKPESGWLFWLTGWERYAIRDVQQAEIMPTKNAGDQYLSGEQLLGTITSAEEFLHKREHHGKEQEN